MSTVALVNKNTDKHIRFNPSAYTNTCKCFRLIRIPDNTNILRRVPGVVITESTIIVSANIKVQTPWISYLSLS